MIEDLGFVKGRIVEAIVTTYNDDGSPNAAPMGVRTGDEDHIVIMAHEGTDTAENILRTGSFCINIIHDPYLFLKTTLAGHGKGGEEPELDSGEFDKCSSVDAPYIKDAAAIIEARLEKTSEFTRSDDLGETKFASVLAGVSKVNIINSTPKGYNRALGASVELAIELSRGNDKNIKNYLTIIKKTLDNKEYGKIKAFIDSLH